MLASGGEIQNRCKYSCLVVGEGGVPPSLASLSCIHSPQRWWGAQRLSVQQSLDKGDLPTFCSVLFWFVFQSPLKESFP